MKRCFNCRFWEPYLAANRCYPKPCPQCLHRAYVEGHLNGYKDGHKHGIEYAQDVLGEGVEES